MTMSSRCTDSENSRIQERRHEATGSVRLVGKDGDIIWSTTQESNGGKFRSAMADVADKIMKQLAEETAPLGNRDALTRTTCAVATFRKLSLPPPVEPLCFRKARAPRGRMSPIIGEPARREPLEWNRPITRTRRETYGGTGPYRALHSVPMTLPVRFKRPWTAATRLAFPR